MTNIVTEFGSNSILISLNKPNPEATFPPETYPEIIEVKKLEHERSNFGGIWHSDTTYLEEPPMGSMLLAREVPPHGGDTLFANQYLAYETLSDTMRRLLDGLVGISSSAKADVSKTREDRLRTDGKESGPPREYVAEHPVVRTHPETGRRCLYVNIAHTSGIKGMTSLNFPTRHWARKPLAPQHGPA